jgi:predicted metal-dependent hydrolase
MAMKKRDPQLALRLEGKAPDGPARWHDGAAIAYLGGALTLRLGTACRETTLAGGELHLPLPPQATARQIQDAAESWLRQSALQLLSLQVAEASRRLGCPPPAVVLSFAARAPWVEATGRGAAATLRCHWRLVEQPPEAIAQRIGAAVARLPRPADNLDLFALA